MRQDRSIDLGPQKLDLSNLLAVTPQACWQAWIREICADESMDRDRIIRHIQEHVGNHMPNHDAPEKRWVEWLGGCYNLLAILGFMVGCEPSFQTGFELLFRKWATEPHDHTPPPEHVVSPKHHITDVSGSVYDDAS